MEESSFEEVFEDVSWELCMEAASMARTELSILVYGDIENPEEAKPAKSLEEAGEWLMLPETGGVRIGGSWKAGGRRGVLEVVYIKPLSPSATKSFIVRFLNETITLRIAKELMTQKNPRFEVSDGLH